MRTLPRTAAAKELPRRLEPSRAIARRCGTVSTGTTGAGAAAGRSAFVGGRWVPAASLDGPRRVRYDIAVTGSLYARWYEAAPPGRRNHDVEPRVPPERHGVHAALPVLPVLAARREQEKIKDESLRRDEESSL